MRKIVFILQCILLSIIVQTATGSSSGRDAERSSMPLVVLKPEIKSYSHDNTKYDINCQSIKPFLKTIMVIENPDIANRKLKLTVKQHKVEVNPVKDLNVNSTSGRYVIGFDQNMRNIAGKGDKIFVSGISQDRYYSYALLKPRFSYYNPGSKEYLGTDLLIIGRATVVNREKISTLQIEEATDLIETGTIVLPGRGIKLTNNIQAKVSIKDFKGTILSVIPTINNSATYNVVLINIGSRDGITIGELLQVKGQPVKVSDPYSSKVDHILPSKDSKGEIVVYDVFNKMSLGIIIKSQTTISELDTVVNRL